MARRSRFSHYIPWIAVGPGVRENYDLTLEPNLAVHVEDVFATALNFLGFAIPVDSTANPFSLSTTNTKRPGLPGRRKE